MKKKKINGVLIGIVSAFFIGAITLVVTGKINLSDIMGNTAQGGYTCVEGFRLEGTKCIKEVRIKATGGYTCPNTYVLEGSTCKSNVAATATYKCSEGETLVGKTCVKEATGVTYTCPSGYYKYGTTQCRKSTNAYTCPTGYTLSGTQCRKVSRYTYTCPTGYIASGAQCKKVSSYIYTCPSGYSKYGTSQCRKTTYTYTCPSGYSKYGTSQCRKTTYTYTCPSGYSKYGTSQCRKTTYTYTCPSGYSKYGTSQCRKTIYTYTCPSGYYKYGTTRCKKGNTIINATRRTSYSTINATRTAQYSTINATRTAQYSTINATRTAQYSTVNATRTAQYSTVNATRTAQYSTINATRTTKYSTINAIKKQTCPAGWSIYNTNKCSKNATIQYQCSTGTLSNKRCIIVKAATYSNNSCPSDYGYDAAKNECYKSIVTNATKRGSVNVGSFNFESSYYTFEMDKTFGKSVRFNVKTNSGRSLTNVTGSCSVSNPNVIVVDNFNGVFLQKGNSSRSAQIWIKTVAPGTSTLTCTLTTGHKATTTITIK